MLTAVDGHGGNYQTKCAFNLMWLTHARPSEVVEAEWAEFGPHATRTSGSTRLNEMGYSPDWIERQQAVWAVQVLAKNYDHTKSLAVLGKQMAAGENPLPGLMSLLAEPR